MFWNLKRRKRGEGEGGQGEEEVEEGSNMVMDFKHWWILKWLKE